MADKKPLVVLSGPTAVGKSKTGVLLAKALDGEIISADSMQVYRYMNIGTAKLSKEEMDGVPHYLIDVLDPDEEFNVFLFQQMAKEALDQIYENGHLPIVVGGTGFYIQALLYDVDFTEQEPDQSFRDEMEVLAQKEGPEVLHDRLKQVDSMAAEAIHPNNVKRVIRALEYHELTGEKISEHNEQEREKESPYDFSYFVLTDERAHLYDQIDARVDQMLRDGLVSEVEGLKDRGYTRDLTSMQGLGYREILAYLDGETSYEEAVREIKQDTRHFAKRQLTWFKREKDVSWIDIRSFGYDHANVAEEIKKQWRE